MKQLLDQQTIQINGASLKPSPPFCIVGIPDSLAYCQCQDELHPHLESLSLQNAQSLALQSIQSLMHPEDFESLSNLDASSNPEILKKLLDPQKSLSPDILQALTNPEIIRAITDPGFLKALSDPSVLKLVQDPQALQALIQQAANEAEATAPQEAMRQPNARIESSQSANGDILSGVHALRFVLKKIGIFELFQKHVKDPRRSASVVYSVESLLMCALLMFLLRRPSRNSMHQEPKLSPAFEENIAKLAGATSMPCAKTIEDLFLELDAKQLEPILPAIFRWLIRSKVFKNHPEFTGDASGTSFIFSIDAHHNHTYYPESQHPAEMCPYCLKRIKGDTVWYMHYDVVLAFIGGDAFKMPLFIHHVSAQQKQPDPSCGDEHFKQECEFSALESLLKQFRSEFPRLQATLLFDSLYANATTMELCAKYNFEYIITRKDGSLKTLSSDIEGLKKIIKPIQKTSVKGNWRIERIAFLFPGLSHRGHNFDVTELEEKSFKLDTKRFAKVNKKESHWQWIHSKKVGNIFEAIQNARGRWNEEDLFNTAENRGFNIGHDFSRAPSSQLIWTTVLYIAMALSNVITLSREGYLSRKSVSITIWIEHIFATLVSPILDIFWEKPLPKQLRFCFDTS